MNLRTFFHIVELRTKIVSVSTFFLALVYTAYSGTIPPLVPAILTLAAALAVDMGTTAFNSYFDFIRRVDHRTENREREKVLVHEGVDPGMALVSGMGCFGVALVLGAIIALTRGLEIAVAGGLCMAVGFFYTGGPKPISTTPFGELFAGGFLGGVFFLIVVYILTGSVSITTAAAALPSTLMIASILAANNACDIEGDRRAGRRTLAILVGRTWAGRLVPVFGIVTLIVVVFLGAMGVVSKLMPLLMLLAALPAAREYRRMFTEGFSHQTKSSVMGGISRVFLIFSLAYLLGLLPGAVISG